MLDSCKMEYKDEAVQGVFKNMSNPQTERKLNES